MLKVIWISISLLVAGSLESEIQDRAPVVGSTAEAAEKTLLKRVDPVYPPLAKATRIQGVVKLKITISETGAVVSTTVLSGHPLLVQAALDAVKQWKYKPMVVASVALKVVTEVEIPFSLGISDTDYKQEQKNNDAFFKQQDNCRGLLKAQKWMEAETSCGALPDLAGKLPSVRQLERMEAYQLAGQALLMRGKPGDALKHFQEEVAIAEVALKPHEAELGYAYRHVAWGYHATGDFVRAKLNYEQAEATLLKARQAMDEDFYKVEYAKAIQAVLGDYVTLLKQSGQDAAAAKVQERADSIGKEIHPVKQP